jgi:hypothetical protein
MRFIVEGEPEMSYLSISDLARKHNIPPRRISDAFYNRRLDENRCLVVGNRRLIPEDYLPDAEATLRDMGILPRIAIPEPTEMSHG